MDKLSFCKTLAFKAGKILKEKYRENTKNNIHFKSPKDLVTDTDRQLEDFIVSEIKNTFPEHAILGEENTEIDSSSPYKWVIDPIDGTTNFIHKIPFFSISIALEYKNKSLAGVVYNPILNEMFWSETGKGAYLNDKQIYVSDTEELIDSIAITGFACLRANLKKNNLQNFCNVAGIVRGIRRFGSAALDLCSIACGRGDVFWEIYLNPWDIAAGKLIIREAGGTVTDFKNNPDSQDCNTGNSIVASNSKLHNKILDILIKP